MKRLQQIFFDVDSTLVTIEGLDWLAEQKGVYREVATLTELSMDGSVAIDDIFEQKLQILSPSAAEMQKIGEKYCASLTENAADVIEALQAMGKEVWLVTGNFIPAVEILARHLDVPLVHVKANTLFFKPCGCFEEIDTKSPLTKLQGKGEIVKKLTKGKHSVFVGDSVTDLATKPYVDLFIGYGGVVEREIVKHHANIFLTSQSLAPLLPIILTREEREVARSAYPILMSKAEQLLKENAVLYNTT